MLKKITLSNTYKVVLLLCVSINVFAQYKTETFELKNAPYSISSQIQVRDFVLSINNEPIFSISETFTTSQTTNKQHNKWGIIKKAGTAFSKTLFPFEYSFNMPDKLFIDKNGNLILPSSEYIYGYHVLYSNNTKKSFLAYEKDTDIQYFRDTYKSYDIAKQNYTALFFKHSAFDGSNFHSSSPDEKSYVTINANGQNLIKDYFLLTNKEVAKYGKGNGGFFLEPLDVTKTKSAVWTNHDGSYNGVIIEHFNNKANVYALDEYERANTIFSDGNNGVFAVVGQSQKIVHIENGKKTNVLSISNDGYYVVDFFQVQNNSLWFINKETSEICNVDISGKLTKIKIDFDPYEIVRFVKENNTNTFWFLLKNNILKKVSLQSINSLVADFSYSPDIATAPITFQDQSTGSPTSWKWDFGDGTSSTQQNPVKTYTKEGKYKVTLTVSKAGATNSTVSKEIDVKVQNQEPVSDGLVAYYPFEGNANDESGNGNHGKVYGATFTKGNKGLSLRTLGVESTGGTKNPDYVLVKNSNSLKFKSECTIAYWIKIEGSKAQDYSYGCGYDIVEGKYGTTIGKSGDRNGFRLLEYEKSASVVINPYNGGFDASAENIAIGFQKWRHMTYVFTQNSIKIYVNGVLTKTETGPVDFTRANTQDLYIGAEYNYLCDGTFWGALNGTLDELRIYNKALSQNEIEDLSRETVAINRSIKIISPTSNSTLNALVPIKIGLEYGEGTIIAGLKVEIKNLDGSLKKSLGNVNGYDLSNRSFKIDDIPPGDYYLKVAGVSQPNLRDSVRVKISGLHKEIVELKWRNSESTGLVLPRGVVADGVSRLLIEINEGELKANQVIGLSETIGSVKLSLTDVKGLKTNIGNVQTINSQNEILFNTAVIHKSLTSVTNKFKSEGSFYFDYLAPPDFNRGIEDDYFSKEREITLNFELLNSSNAVIGTHQRTISIVRPPLMLAHGLGGGGSEADESTWRKFRYNDAAGNEILFKNANLFLVKRDINLYPTAGFDVNSDVLLGLDNSKMLESFPAMLQQMHDLGYAAAKVDYVAHSMGGSVLRNTLEKPEYKNPQNYNQGYVNKFITICTPHQGSPLGDIMSEFAPHLSVTNDDFLSFVLPDFSTFIKDFWKRKPDAVDAVKNMAIRKENGGIRLKKTEIKNHTIFSNYTAKFNYDYKALFGSLSGFGGDLKINSSGLDHVTLAMAFAAINKFEKCGCSNEANEVRELIKNNTKILSNENAAISLLQKALAFGSYLPVNIVIPTSNLVPEFYNWASRRVYPNGGDFFNQSDMIVSVESQSAGRFKKWQNGEASPDKEFFTVYDSITHNFAPFKATSDLTVGNRVFQLLNKPINSKYFSDELPASPEITTPISCFDNCVSVSANNTSVKVFPNPIIDRFEIDMSNTNISGKYRVEVVDLKGIVIKAESFDNQCCPIIHHRFSGPGVYTVRVTNDKETYSSKLIVNP
jgi:PKD repeat protein